MTGRACIDINYENIALIRDNIRQAILESFFSRMFIYSLIIDVLIYSQAWYYKKDIKKLPLKNKLLYAITLIMIWAFSFIVKFIYVFLSDFALIPTAIIFIYIAISMYLNIKLIIDLGIHEELNYGDLQSPT